MFFRTKDDPQLETLFMIHIASLAFKFIPCEFNTLIYFLEMLPIRKICIAAYLGWGMNKIFRWSKKSWDARNKGFSAENIVCNKQLSIKQQSISNFVSLFRKIDHIFKMRPLLQTKELISYCHDILWLVQIVWMVF